MRINVDEMYRKYGLEKGVVNVGNKTVKLGEKDAVKKINNHLREVFEAHRGRTQ